jgi:hypothetical protein
MVVAFCFFLIFLFVPETFWDRTPRPKLHTKSRRSTWTSLGGLFTPSHLKKDINPLEGNHDGPSDMRKIAIENATAAYDPAAGTIAQRRQQKANHHVGFTDDLVVPPQEDAHDPQSKAIPTPLRATLDNFSSPTTAKAPTHLAVPGTESQDEPEIRPLGARHSDSWRVEPHGDGPKTPALHNFNSPSYITKESPNTDYLDPGHGSNYPLSAHTDPSSTVAEPATTPMTEKSSASSIQPPLAYTHHLRTQPPKTFRQTLRPWNGRLRTDNWFKVAIRPFILFAYPSILWSTLVYSLSVGWLIVLSESMSVIFRNPSYTYNFSALGTGLIYVSPFIGGILGTAVAGKVSDIIVRFMARRNGGIYEPEFRLVMALPVAITTTIGLMGFGWSAAEHDRWIVPAVFFGVISFGCSLGSTTAITFAVDSYRQYAGEALVTLNFSKSEYLALLAGKENANLSNRYLPWSCLLPVLPRLVTSGWIERRLHRYWMHPTRLPDDHDTDVYLWKESANVDREEEHDGAMVIVLCSA